MKPSFRIGKTVYMTTAIKSVERQNVGKDYESLLITFVDGSEKTVGKYWEGKLYSDLVEMFDLWD